MDYKKNSEVSLNRYLINLIDKIMSYFSNPNHACNNLSMGFYRPPNKHQYLNYNERPNNTEIDTIVIHYTVANYAKSYYLLGHADGGRPGPSVHYMINADGRIDNLVDCSHRAWHAGKSKWKGSNSVNDNSIGIELVNPGSGENCCFKLPFEECSSNFNQITDCTVNPFPKEQMYSLINVIKCLKVEYPAVGKNIVAHADIASQRKIDPGVAFNWTMLCEYEIGLCSSQKNISEPISILYRFEDQDEGVRELKEKLHEFGYGYIDPNINDYSKILTYVARAFQLHFDITSGKEAGWGSWTNRSQTILDDLLGSCSSNMEDINSEL